LNLIIASLLSLSLCTSSGTVTGNEIANKDPNPLPEVDDEEELGDHLPTNNGGVLNSLDKRDQDEDDDASAVDDDTYQCEPEEAAANEETPPRRKDEKRRRESQQKMRRMSWRATDIRNITVRVPRRKRRSYVSQHMDINALSVAIDVDVQDPGDIRLLGASGPQNDEVPMDESEPQNDEVPMDEAVGDDDEQSAAEKLGRHQELMMGIFSFMGERDLMVFGTTVNTQWSDWATDAHVDLLRKSIPLKADDDDNDGEEAEDKSAIVRIATRKTILERPWEFLHESLFPWACFLGEGGAKKVYRVYNSAANGEEAISVMYVQFSVYPDIEILHSPPDT